MSDEDISNENFIYNIYYLNEKRFTEYRPFHLSSKWDREYSYVKYYDFVPLEYPNLPNLRWRDKNKQQIIDLFQFYYFDILVNWVFNPRNENNEIWVLLQVKNSMPISINYNVPPLPPISFSQKAVTWNRLKKQWETWPDNSIWI